MSATDWGQALALVLIIEGLLPLLLPSQWRVMLTQVMRWQDGQIRFFGLCCLLSGMLLLAWQL